MPAIPAMILVRWSSCSAGVLSVSVLFQQIGDIAISVAMPVSSHHESPRPRVTDVFIKAMFAWSPREPPLRMTSVSRRSDAFTVGAASSISSVAATQGRRPSAGTRLPASMSTMSPGTSRIRFDLDRLTVAAHAAISFIVLANAARLSSALASPRRPSTALNRQADQHDGCRAPSRVTTKLTAAATSRMICMSNPDTGARTC